MHHYSLSLVQLYKLCELGLSFSLWMSFASLQPVTYPTSPDLCTWIALVAFDAVCIASACHLSYSAISANLDCLSRYGCHLPRNSLSLVQLHLIYVLVPGSPCLFLASLVSLQLVTCLALPALRTRTVILNADVISLITVCHVSDSTSSVHLDCLDCY